MESLLVAAWVVLAAMLLGPALLGVHRSTWPLRSDRLSDADTDDAETTPAPAPTPVGQCRACGEDGQAGFTYCEVCLTPLPRPLGGRDADGLEGTAAD